MATLGEIYSLFSVGFDFPLYQGMNVGFYPTSAVRVGFYSDCNRFWSLLTSTFMFSFKLDLRILNFCTHV